jgi:hypothetical protein
MLLTLLTITVVAVGGPPGPHHRTPTFSPFVGAVVRVIQSGRVIASSEEGNLAVRVRPGVYELTAEMGEMVSNHPAPCYQGRSLGRSVRVGHRAKTVKLYCQIK